MNNSLHCSLLVFEKCRWIISRRVSATNSFISPLVTRDITSAWFTAVAHIAHVRHINIFPSLFLDHKSHFNIAFWALTFRASSEEYRWMDFAGVFWSHVIVFEAQTAPWIAFFNFAEKNPGPVPTQQSATAWESVDGNSFPVFFRQLESCCCSIGVHSKIFFSISVFVFVWWIRVIPRTLKNVQNDITTKTEKRIVESGEEVNYKRPKKGNAVGQFSERNRNSDGKFWAWSWNGKVDKSMIKSSLVPGPFVRNRANN